MTREFLKKFDGNAWGNNGPGVITRVLQQMCHTNATNLMSPEQCHNFHVLPVNQFNAISYQVWNFFFDKNMTNEVMELTKSSIGVHLWNKFSHQEIIRVGSNVAYELLAEKYCPMVYQSCGEYF